MEFVIITLFPDFFSSIFSQSILARAQKENTIKIELINLREFGLGRHKMIDDKPYGGGVGMVMRVDVLERAIRHARKGIRGEKVILLDPKGKLYRQENAESLSKLKRIILICGHYEGFDERIRNFVDEEISIGDYILSGGELAAAVIIESVSRLIPDVLKKSDASKIESFTQTESGRIFEAPQYTRPPVFKGKKVPKELLSGNFKLIDNFRAKSAGKLTRERRPDLLRD